MNWIIRNPLLILIALLLGYIAYLNFFKVPALKAETEAVKQELGRQQQELVQDFIAQAKKVNDRVVLSTKKADSLLKTVEVYKSRADLKPRLAKARVVYRNKTVDASIQVDSLLALAEDQQEQLAICERSREDLRVKSVQAIDWIIQDVGVQNDLFDKIPKVPLLDPVVKEKRGIRPLHIIIGAALIGIGYAAGAK